jgi:hypothetical protein
MADNFAAGLEPNTVQLRRAHRVMHYAPNCKFGHPERSEELALSKAKGSAFFRALNNMTRSFFFARSRLAFLTERYWA